MVGMERTPEETLIISATNYRNTEAARLAAVRDRNQAIRNAHAAGIKQIDIVRITGLNREQIRKICKGLQPQERAS